MVRERAHRVGRKGDDFRYTLRLIWEYDDVIVLAGNHTASHLLYGLPMKAEIAEIKDYDTACQRKEIVDRFKL